MLQRAVVLFTLLYLRLVTTAVAQPLRMPVSHIFLIIMARPLALRELHPTLFRLISGTKPVECSWGLARRHEAAGPAPRVD
ncbi:hypothetical protein ACFWVC_11610 [Streptomyces sp. NPDC058691]|uniref:hypothetical protein n=1 Tax=Streptomyces sp. NPDC058691 TaxID=3346601 RepID=UPI00365DBF50